MGYAIRADARNSTHAPSLFKRANDAVSRIDALVNNPGIPLLSRNAIVLSATDRSESGFY
jgi:hypothetical protein